MVRGRILQADLPAIRLKASLDALRDTEPNCNTHQYPPRNRLPSFPFAKCGVQHARFLWKYSCRFAVCRFIVRGLAAGLGIGRGPQSSASEARACRTAVRTSP